MSDEREHALRRIADGLGMQEALADEMNHHWSAGLPQGSWVVLDGGTLDIGIIRDSALCFGDRWRPWKRWLGVSLFHRCLVPEFVRRWFGWQPFDVSEFFEEVKVAQ